MLREFVIICAAASVCKSPLHVAAENATAESLLPTSVTTTTTVKTDHSVAAKQQDNDALPSESSYQSVVPHPINHFLPPGTYEANAAVVQTLPDNVIIESNSVSGQSNGLGYENQPVTTFYSAIVASDPDSPENNNILETSDKDNVPIRPYYSVPVAAKTLTIDQATNAANIAYNNDLAPGQYYAVPLAVKTVETFKEVDTNPAAKYIIYNPDIANIDASKYFALPMGTKKVSIESHGTVNVHPSVPYAVQQPQPNVAFTNQSPALVKYSVNHVVKPPVAQVSAPSIAYAVNPAVPASVTSKKIYTVEAFNSVTAHPRPTRKYTTGLSLIRYASAYNSVPKPVPVPVIYQVSAVETNSPATLQLAPPTAATYVRAPVNLGAGTLYKYNSAPIPRVYAESFIENVYTPVGPTPVSSATPGNSHTRTVVFSPASEVSSVAFNGFGTSYGW